MPDYFAGDVRSQRDRMLAGEFYLADGPELEVARVRAAATADVYLRQVVAGDSRAAQTLRSLLGGIGEGVTVRPPLFVDHGSNLVIGPRMFVNQNLTALDVAPIRIGSNCQIGPNVQLLTPTHPIDPQPRRDKMEAAQPITIGDNVWPGGGVIVCPGVTIGENSVIGAGAVVPATSWQRCRRRQTRPSACWLSTRRWPRSGPTSASLCRRTRRRSPASIRSSREAVQSCRLSSPNQAGETSDRRIRLSPPDRAVMRASVSFAAPLRGARRRSQREGR